MAGSVIERKWQTCPLANNTSRASGPCPARNARVLRQLRTRILCIDDDLLFCELLKRFFTHTAEFFVEYESNAFRAIHKMRAFKPDVVLLDIHMPGQNGFRIAQIMREEPWLRHRPIIFYSGMENAEAELDRLRISQPWEFVRKGVPLAVLEETVRQTLAEKLQHEKKKPGNSMDRRESDIQPMNAISICRETRLGVH